MTTQIDTTRAVDRATRPAVPPSVTDLWDGWGYRGLTGAPDADAAQLRTALAGITSVVNAMAGGDHYRVGLLGQGTAYTDLKARLVNVTTAALHDPRLTLDEALGVTTAMAVHEAGHGRVSRPMERAVKSAFGEAHPFAHRLSNIVDDVRLEADTAAQWPAYGGLFPLALWWVAQRYPSGGVTRVPTSQAEAVNLSIAAIRYDDLTTWAPDEALQAERAWWKRWGADAAKQQRPMDHVAAIREALAHIADLPENAPAPTAPIMPDAGEGQGMDEGDEQDPGDDGSGTDWSNEALDADEADGEGRGESDDDESDEDDEPVSLPGLPGEADDEADASAGTPDEGATDGAGTPADEAGEAPGEADQSDRAGADEYRHTDEATQPDTGETAEASDVQVYGRTDDTDWSPDAVSQPGDDETQHPERDALTDSLPAHATDAVTADDRDRDIRLGRVMVQTSRAEAKDSIRVTHIGGYDYNTGKDDPNTVHERTAGIVPLETKRTAIHTNPAVQGALRAAFTSRRTSRDNRDVARSGRLSGARAYRVRAGFDNVFTRRDSLSPDRLDVHLLVDASGSMHGHRVEMAAQMAANITEGLAHLPFVRVHVWAHNTANGTTLWDVYDSRRGDKIGRIGGIRSAAANNDATAIAALTQRITDERTSREKSVMVVISDGAPCEDESWVRAAVDAARKKKVGVMSVAIAGGLTKTQEACYGPEWVVPWSDWDSLSRGIARMVGRLA